MPAIFPAFLRAGARGTILLLALLVPLACGDGEPASRSGPADPLDPLAAQADEPLVSSDAVVVSEAFRIGPAARAQAGLERPLDLAYDVGGSLYLLDGTQPTRIVKFDSTGDFLLRFGRHEPDVERIGRATAFAIAPWNTVLLVDKEHNLLVSFLTMGTFVGATQIHGIGMNVLPLSTFGEFYLQKWDPERRRAYVVHMRAPVDSLGTPYSIGIPAGQPVRKEARDVAFRTAVDRQDRLYVAFAEAYPVRVLTSEGRTLRLVGIDRSPVAKTAAEIDMERARNYGEIEARLPDISDSLKAEAAEPDPVHPLIEELAIDPAGRLWVRTHRADPAREVTFYDVFNAEGHFLAEVRVPGDVRRTAFAPDGTLVVIDATSEASREVVGYRTGFGGEAPAGGAPPAEASTVEPAPEPAGG